METKFSNFTISLIYFRFNILNLFIYIMSFHCSIFILWSKYFQLMLKTLDNHNLAVDLSFIITSQKCNALIKCFLSSMKIFNLSSNCGKISIIEFLWFNFSSVSWNNPLSYSLTDLSHLILFLMFILNFYIFLMFSLLPLFSMLFKMAKSRLIFHNFSNWWIDNSVVNYWRCYNNSLRRTWSDWSSLISASVIKSLIFNFLCREMSIKFTGMVSSVITSSIIYWSICNILWSLSILRFKLIWLCLISSWTFKIVSTWISLFLFVFLVGSCILLRGISR